MKNLINKLRDNLIQKPFETSIKIGAIGGAILVPFFEMKGIPVKDVGHFIMYASGFGCGGMIAGGVCGIPLGVINYFITKSKRPKLIKTLFIMEKNNGYSVDTLNPIEIKYNKEGLPKENFLIDSGYRSREFFGRDGIYYKKVGDNFLIYQDDGWLNHAKEDLEICNDESKAKERCFNNLVERYDILNRKESYIMKEDSDRWEKLNTAHTIQ